MIGKVERSASPLGLRFRPDKCAVIARSLDVDIPAVISLQGERIPIITKRLVTDSGAPKGLGHSLVELKQAISTLLRGHEPRMRLSSRSVAKA